jgi:hypothetical protein
MTRRLIIIFAVVALIGVGYVVYRRHRAQTAFPPPPPPPPPIKSPPPNNKARPGLYDQVTGAIANGQAAGTTAVCQTFGGPAGACSAAGSVAGGLISVQAGAVKSVGNWLGGIF